MIKTDIQIAAEECAKEQVHLIAQSQEFGFIVCVDPASGLIIQVSENISKLFGKKAEDYIFQSFQECFFQLEVPRVLEKVHRHLALPSDNDGIFLPYVVHHHINDQGIWVLEFIKNRDATHDWLKQSLFLQDTVDVIRNARSLDEMLKTLSDKIAEITGFKHVMIYKFDPDWNGEVVAETNEGMDTYLGHHFPASDIPPQARDLFLSNWVRMIPDVNATPQYMHPPVPQNTGKPLNLKMSQLRFPSKIHIEYLKNMKVNSTLTLSLISKNKLWGLVACHHDTKKVITALEYEFCQTLAQLVSSLVEVKIKLDEEQGYRSTQILIDQIKENIRLQPNLSNLLIRMKPALLDIFPSSETATAFNLDGRWSVAGKCPTLPQIRSLATWLSSHMKDQEVFYTDNLSSHYPPASVFSDVASGLMVISIPKKENNIILFFRPEVIQTKTWAGNPQKAVVHSESGKLVLHPRSSFEMWKQNITNKSLPWTNAEIALASELRKTLIEVDLEKQFVSEKQARADAETERKRFVFISQASLKLSSSLEQDDIIDQLGELSTDGLCEWSCLRLYTYEDHSWSYPIFHHKNPGMLERFKELASSEALQTTPKYLTDILEGRPVFHPRVKEDFAKDWLRNQKSLIDFNRKIGLKSFLAVPIITSHGVLLGTIEWGISESYRYFTQKDLEVAIQLALRAATALENSQLWSKAQKEVKTREDMVGIVSHDLKNPLTSISFNAQMIERYLKKGSVEKLDDPLTRIGSSVSNMRKLIDDLLSITTIDAGKLTVDLSPLSAQSIASEAIDLMSPTALLKKIDLILMAPKGDLYIKADKDRIMQVFSNLIGNAIKFSRDYGRVVLSISEANEFINFKIQDFGKGISKPNLTSIFDQFWQESSTKKQGSGLGLSIAKGIVEAHNGRIWVESELEKGSSFYFSIPKADLN